MSEGAAELPLGEVGAPNAAAGFATSQAANGEATAVSPDASFAPATIAAPLPLIAQPRIYAFDAIRAFWLFLVVLHHASVPYMKPAQDLWQPDPNFHSATISVMLLTIQMLVLPAFFIMSGFFARASFFKYGAEKFFRERRKHLLVPFAIVWPLTAIMASRFISFPDSFIPGRRLFIALCLLYHLWFLLYLFVIVWIAVWWHRLIDPKITAQGKANIDRFVAWMFRTPWAILIGALITVWPLYFMKAGFIDTATTWIPLPRVIVYYTLWFAIGWLFQRQPAVLESIRRWRWWSYVLMIVLFVITMKKTMALVNLPDVESQRAAAVRIRPTVALWVWAMNCGLIGFVMHNFNRPSEKIRYLAEASYWVYLLHLIVVMPMQHVIRFMPIPGPQKILLIVGGTTALLLATWPVVRPTKIGEYLGGPRKKAGAFPVVQTKLEETAPPMVESMPAVAVAADS